jgi:hypothetical protein
MPVSWQKMKRVLCILASGILLTQALNAAPGTVEVDGNLLRTQRHVIRLSESGLPAEIHIGAAKNELPLKVRGLQEIPPGILQSIGRGVQLQDMAVEVRSGGGTVEVTRTGDLQIQEDGRGARVRSRLKAGELSLRLNLHYSANGALFGELTYGGEGASIDELAVIAQLNGQVDFVLPVWPRPAALRAVPDEDFRPDDVEKGRIWANAGSYVESRGVVRTGVLDHVFVGTGDTGFTWLCDPASGLEVTDEVAFCALNRAQDGTVSWRMSPINHAVEVQGEKIVRFALLIHPAAEPAALTRKQMWMEGPRTLGSAETLPLTFGDRMELNGEQRPALRADVATVYEPLSDRIILSGQAGGDAISVEQDLSDTYPSLLFRYYAGTHSHARALIRSNARELIRAGMTPGPGRMVMGRAILHDIAADITRQAHVVSAMKLLKALEDFGLFKGDGQTEFIPYWRAGTVARYGEEYSAGDRFSTGDREMIARQVRTSVYRRPAGDGHYKVLVVVVNETDASQAQQLYLFNPAEVLGGGNVVSQQQYIGRFYKESDIPEHSDWREENIRSMIPGTQFTRADRQANAEVPRTVLRDVENDRAVRTATKREEVEIFGPLFIPAHDFRVLYASGAE